MANKPRLESNAALLADLLRQAAEPGAKLVAEQPERLRNRFEATWRAHTVKMDELWSEDYLVNAGERAKLSLRVRHPSMSAKPIQQKMGRTARPAYEAGERREKATNKPLPTRWNQAYCCFQFEDVREVDDLPAAIAAGLDELDREPEFWDQFVASGGSIE